MKQRVADVLLHVLAGIALVLAGRWLLHRLWRVLLLPTNDSTAPITPDDVQPGMRRLIVSDLHWGSGDRLDDFTSDADDAFADFVRSYALSNEPTELVLAGDTFEFLQVRLPQLDDFDWSAEAAATRLHSILEAHAAPVDALRAFVQQPGNQLTLLIGNHDFELHYHAAKNVLRHALQVAESDQRLRFGLRYEGDGIYLEHGNQYDAWNRFVRFEGISKPFEVVRGTWIVKDIINPLEDDPLDIAPLIDNVKPTWAFLWYLLSLPRLRQAASRRYMLRTLWRVLRAASLPRNLLWQVSGPFEDQSRPAPIRPNREATNAQPTEQLQLRNLQEALLRWLRRGDPSSAVAIDHLVQEAEQQLRREIRGFKRAFARAMAHIAASPEHGHNAIFVCGHTHLAQVVQLNERQTYFNTGTWTTVVRDVATGEGEQRRYPFLQVHVVAGQPPHAELLVWEDRATLPHPWRKTDEIESRAVPAPNASA